MNRSDESLLDASLAGEPEAFGILVARYERRVYGLILRLSGRPGEAQDLFQTVWMHAFISRTSFKRRAKFSTWLYALTLNQVRNWRRQKAQQAARSADLEFEPADPRPGILDRLLKRDDEARLRRALRRLDQGDQELLALYYLQDLDYGEIATITGKRTGHLRVLVHRALERLRFKLEKDET